MGEGVEEDRTGISEVGSSEFAAGVVNDNGESTIAIIALTRSNIDGGGMDNK